MIKENRFQEYAMLEKHILEARAKAMAYEDREEMKRQRVCEDPDRFGVPPTKSYFSYCLDDTLLKDSGLLAPSDYYCRVKTPILAMPKIQKSDLHMRETIASTARSWARSASTKFLKSGAFDPVEELDYQKEGSCIVSDDNSISSDDEDVTKITHFESYNKHICIDLFLLITRIEYQKAILERDLKARLKRISQE